jgi:hypothetical protein
LLVHARLFHTRFHAPLDARHALRSAEEFSNV